MSGKDTAAGIGFQHVVAVDACMRALVDPRIAAIRVEGIEDVIDIEALDDEGDLVWAIQVKSRGEMRTWGARELIGVLRAWFAAKPASGVEFTFVTDGDLGPSTRDIRDAIEAASRNGRVDKHRSILQEVGVQRLSALRGIRILSRVGSSEVLLERAVVKVLRLGEPFSESSLKQASSSIDALLKLVLLRAGERLADARSISVEEIGGVLGLDRTSLIAGGDPNRALGSIASEVVVEESGSGLPPIPRPALLSGAMGALGVDASGGTATVIPTSVALWGPPGFGKTHVAKQVYDGCRGLGLEVRWIDAGPEAAAATVAARLSRPGQGPIDDSLSSAAARLRQLTASVDVLICDDVWSDELARLLREAVSNRCALLVTTTRREVAEQLETHQEITDLPTEAIRALLEAELGPAEDLGILSDAIQGWALLLDLVRRSLRRHISPDHSREVPSPAPGHLT